MADQTKYAMASESQVVPEPYISKQWSYIIDSNSGVYQSSQVTLDTSSWSNSGKFVDWSEAYFTIPMVMVAYPTGAAITGWDAWDASWMVGIKNGHQQLIDSFSCDVQNSSIIQLTRYTNIYTTYRMLTSMSADELRNIAPSIGFFPDTSDSFGYTNTQSPGGHGSQNNLVWGFEKLYPNNSGLIYAAVSVAPGANIVAGGGGLVHDVASPDGGYLVREPASHSIKTLGNVGLYNRIKYLSFNPALAPYGQLLTTASTTTLLKNYYFDSSPAAPGTVDVGAKVWSYIAKIRLKDISSVFEQLGLVRGLYCRFILNINTCKATFSTTPVNAVLGTFTPDQNTITQNSSNCTYGTCPFMVTSFYPGQPNSTLAEFYTNPTTFAIQNGIGSTEYIEAVTGQTRKVSAMANQVRLYGPLIVMSSTAEEQYLSLNPTRKIVYRDIYEYNANDIAGDGDFNVLLTNGMVNPKTLIVVPFFTASQNGTAFNIQPLKSAFCTEPGTTSPLCAITNYNVALAGVNIYQNNYRYDWESFLTELNEINSINGNQVTGMSSSLITEYDYSNTYRYYVTDLSRRVAAEDYVPKSIQILGSNLNSRAVDLYCFVEVEKILVIDTSSGERLE